MIVFIVIQTLRILTIAAVVAGGIIAYVGFHEGTELQSIAYVLAGIACAVIPYCFMRLVQEVHEAAWGKVKAKVESSSEVEAVASRPTVASMAEEVRGWLAGASLEEHESFVATQYEDLGQYHHTVGQSIRNRFGLWECEWTPLMKDGADHSPDHPDQVSMQVIEEVWKSMQPKGD